MQRAEPDDKRWYASHHEDRLMPRLAGMPVGAGVRATKRVVPVRLAATAQSIYGTMCIGLATALLTLASGLLYERVGGYAFLVMAGFCLLALPLCAGLRLSKVEA